MAKYEVMTEEGAEWVSTDFEKAAVGDVVELDLNPDQERALVAAGWLDKQKGKK